MNHVYLLGLLRGCTAVFAGLTSWESSPCYIVIHMSTINATVVSRDTATCFGLMYPPRSFLCQARLDHRLLYPGSYLSLFTSTVR